MVVGRDILLQLGANIDFENQCMTWDGSNVLLREYPSDQPNVAQDILFDTIDDGLFITNDETFLSDNTMNSPPQDCFVAEIKDSNYQAADLQEVVANCKHLHQRQQQQLYHILKKYDTLFAGTLGCHKDEIVHLELRPDAIPHAARAYNIPHSHLKVFKNELDRLVQIGVLEPCGRSEWISGTFIIPKKDGSVRWITDFRALNKWLRRKVYPLPKIGDILARRTGYRYLSTLDLSMQYYSLQLDDESKELCTIATPFGLFRYCRLPMGVNQAPDIAQEVIETVLKDIKNIECYIDDIAAFSHNWEAHLTLLDTLLSRLQAAGFTCNPRKCKWGVQETEFLGHWLTPTGVKPFKKKVEAILALKPPTNLKELRTFLGMVTYYRDMWPKRSHILTPLTNLCGTKTFTWSPDCQTAFEKMKKVVASDALLAYPDHNLPFTIETDSSDYQLGAIIKQQNRPVAYYTRKLNQAQKRYTTIEKELLSIVETFREFRSMLLGAEIHVYTDHKNLSHRLTSYTTQRVLRWRLLLEEFAPSFHYIKGTDNTMADALSRLPTNAVESRSTLDQLDTNQNLQTMEIHTIHNITTRNTQTHKYITENDHNVTRAQNKNEQINKSIRQKENYFIAKTTQKQRYEIPECGAPPKSSVEDPRQHNPKDTNETDCRRQLISCNSRENWPPSPDHAQWPLEDGLALYPMFDEQGRIPFRFETINHYQQQDHDLLHQLASGRCKERQLGNHKIIVKYLPTTEWKIALPTAMLRPLVRWYHHVSAHAFGRDRLEQAIKTHFYHPRIHAEVLHQVSNCTICERAKTGHRQQGQLAPRDAPLMPWAEVHIDSIGPWKVRINKLDLAFRALTFIDPVTNLLEIVQSHNTTTKETIFLFDVCWLSRYPRPLCCVHDMGPEFKGRNLSHFLHRAGIDSKNISSNTPTANGIVESVHKTVGQIIRTMVHLHPPTTPAEADRLVTSALATAMHATRCAPHHSLSHLSPGALVFKRDMFLDLPIIADMITLQQRRQHQIDERLLRVNAGRTTHDFALGELVYVVRPRLPGDKAKMLYDGPFPIIRVHTNNTVTIQRPHTMQRLSIRRIKLKQRQP